MDIHVTSNVNKSKASCLCNREGQAADLFTESVRLFRRLGGGLYKQTKCSVLCCRVVDACTISNEV